MLEVQTGGTFENKVTEVLWTDYLTVSSDAATTTYKAIGTVGNEIEEVLVKNSDGAPVARLTQGSSVAKDTFTYDPSTKGLKFNTGDIADGSEIVVYYKRNIQADVLENLSDSYSKKCTLYVDALAEDKCSNVFRIQFFIPKADFNGEFSLELGGDQTVHSFEAEGLAGACGTNGALWTYTIFGANAADANA